MSALPASDCRVKWFADDEPNDEDCHRRALVCSECVRALALKWWGAIARHSPFDGLTPTELSDEDVQYLEEMTTCLLCGIGEASYCGEHFLSAVLRQRGALAAGGTRIGEPEWLS